ncbi:hypothetical protein AKO1_002321 [Acrasis kona]|uniref:Cell division protein FtsZ n=1 Tax=Acrasis kona TaxID=1008807 RepID=A0AAW2ZC71_9EUKA
MNKTSLEDLQNIISDIFNGANQQVRFLARLKHLKTDVNSAVVLCIVFHRQNSGEYGFFLFNDTPDVTTKVQLFEAFPINQYFQIKLNDYGKCTFNVKSVDPLRPRKFEFEASSPELLCTVIYTIKRAVFSVEKPHVPVSNLFGKVDDWEDKKISPFSWISLINEKFDLDHQEVLFMNPLYQSFLGEDEVVSSIKIINNDYSTPTYPKASKHDFTDTNRTATLVDEIELSDEEDNGGGIILSSDEEDEKSNEEDWN